MSYSIKIADAEPLYRLISDNTGGRPPGSVLQIILSLIGDPAALQDAIAGRASDAEQTRWTILGRTANALLYVDVTAPVQYWEEDSDGMIEHRIDEAWLRPLSDLAEVRVTDVRTWGGRQHPFLTEWAWQPRFAVVVGDRTAQVPDFARSPNAAKREAGRAFMAQLLGALAGA